MPQRVLLGQQFKNHSTLQKNTPFTVETFGNQRDTMPGFKFRVLHVELGMCLCLWVWCPNYPPMWNPSHLFGLYTEIHFKVISFLIPQINELAGTSSSQNVYSIIVICFEWRAITINGSSLEFVAVMQIMFALYTFSTAVVSVFLRNTAESTPMKRTSGNNFCNRELIYQYITAIKRQVSFVFHI